MAQDPMATLLDILSDPTGGWSRRSPASDAAIRILTEGCDFALPDEYLEFLRYSNGGEGLLCIEPWYFQLCSAEEVVSYNRGYKVEVFLPGYFAIGSNGAGEMLAIRKRDGSPCPVYYMVPFIPMDENDAVQIAFDFEMFAMALGRAGVEP
jgi:hypothetical protein